MVAGRRRRASAEGMGASPYAVATGRRRSPPSVALEYGLGLLEEGLVSALVILGLHADRLRLRFGLDGVVDAHAPFVMDAALGHGVREGRAVGERLRQCLCFGEQRVRLAQLVVESPALG